MAVDDNHADPPLAVRVALLEARVHLIVLLLKGTVAAVAGAVLTYFLQRH